MFRHLKPSEYQYNNSDSKLHPEHQTFDTSVSYYLRKYGTGQLESLPVDTRSEIKDERTVDEMLDDDGLVDGIGLDDLDVLMELERKSSDFDAAFKDIELTKKQKEKFDKAMKILKDNDASLDAKRDAYAILDELKDRVTRTREL